MERKTLQRRCHVVCQTEKMIALHLNLLGAFGMQMKYIEHPGRLEDEPAIWITRSISFFKGFCNQLRAVRFMNNGRSLNPCVQNRPLSFAPNALVQAFVAIEVLADFLDKLL
jgi:hypothetical protein